MFKERIVYNIFVAAVLLSVISGCVSQSPQQAVQTATPTKPAPTAPAPVAGTSVEVLTAPATAEAGHSFEVTWKVNSPVEKNITHTAVHYGNESKSEPLTLQSYPSLTTPQGGKIPASFRANITINNPGVLYFRAHAIIDTVFYWSPEQTITITPAPIVSGTAPTIKVTSYPSIVNGDATFNIQWEVSGGTQGSISQTAIYWGYTSGGANISNYPRASSVQSGKTPAKFSAQFTAPSSGSIYVRAYAKVDGVDVYSQEYPITINPRYTGGGGGY
jgi:hypothetical protein